MLAVSAGRENLVHELLSFGADASISDEHGRCAADYCLFTQQSISELLHQAASWRPRGVLTVAFAVLWSGVLAALAYLPYVSYDEAILKALQRSVETAPIIWILSRHFQWGTAKRKIYLWLMLLLFFICQSFSSDPRTRHVSSPCLELQTLICRHVPIFAFLRQHQVCLWNGCVQIFSTDSLGAVCAVSCARAFSQNNLSIYTKRPAH
jgi:hypothetical protein